MTFEWPLVLLALLVIPLVVVLYVLRERRRTAVAAGFANPALLPNVIDRAPGRLRHVPLILLLLGLTAVVVGAARPHATVNVKREEATVVLVVDVSRSMKAKDVEPTRLDAARGAAKEFVRDVPEKFRVGVVSFATRAVVGVIPTEDRSLVDDALDNLAPGEGTAIGDAVALAAQLGRRQKADDGSAPPRSVLLISDGARDGGALAPQAAARRAKRLGVPVYTVLIGTPNGVVEETLTGGFRQLIRVPPNPDTLREIARLSGGEFFTAADAEGLERVHEDLGSRLGTREESREVGDYFAGGAAAFLLAGGALSALWFRRVP
ncbi:MAG TPA: VWA domain-containing protein [Gaiellaceae bacterium]|nr:VWA domain-containing protein [Gaiellaceae bacterium]